VDGLDAPVLHGPLTPGGQDRRDQIILLSDVVDPEAGQILHLGQARLLALQLAHDRADALLGTADQLA
jgi:hypothetical protein